MRGNGFLLLAVGVILSVSLSTPPLVFLVGYTACCGGGQQRGQVYLVDPFFTGDVPPKPTGLASYGLANQSGFVSGYNVDAPMLVGFVNITSLEAYYPNASSYNVSEYGLSLQLNAMLVALSSNASFVYWVQNVAVFTTNNNTLFYADNIWNMSGVGAALTNTSITSDSGGYVSNTSRGVVYGSGSSNFTYALPLSFRLFVAERVVRGVGVNVGLGVQLLENGSRVGSPISWYDNATIHQPGIIKAYFLVDGESLTPPFAAGSPGLYYDAELVFGGEANGAPTNLTALNSTIGLFYEGPDGRLEHFPSYYSFGADTAESVYDLHVKYLGGGVASVYVGAPNYEYLRRSGGQVPTGLGGQSSGAPGFLGGLGLAAAWGLFGFLVALILVLVVLVIVLARSGGGSPHGGAAQPPPPAGSSWVVLAQISEAV